jgi:DNA-binding NarL/FixJ family response regulator
VTRVLIAHEDDLMRAGFAGLLAIDPEIEIAGEASTDRGAVERARLLAPDVVLMDVRMPDVDGIAATRELARAAPHVRVLILTTSSRTTSSARYALGPRASWSSEPDPRS